MQIYTYAETLVESGLRTQLTEYKLLIANKCVKGSSSSPVIEKIQLKMGYYFLLLKKQRFFF